jgi:magnesium transporter
LFKIIKSTELQTLEQHISERELSYIKNGQVNKFESYEKCNLISFDWYDIKNSKEKPVPVIIYYDKENLFFICENEHSFKNIEKLKKEESTNEKTLYSFFSGLLSKDLDNLHDLEEHITDTEDSLLKASKKKVTTEIVKLRKELLRLKKYYEQLNRIFEGLSENENDIIPRGELRYFRILDNRTDRLFSFVLNLRDYVTQVREAYQAQIDIEQNNIMKVLTVITSVFLPLTLLVGWYGMNLQMPEFGWQFGYPFVIILSVLIIIVSFVLFKRKKWF